jgi:hypothetical protein
MPLIMSLEGPKLAGAPWSPAPRPFMPGELGVPAILQPFQTHAAWTIGGLLLGLWLAGSTPGQGVINRVRSTARNLRSK